MLHLSFWPHLMRAYFMWMKETDLSPHILVDTTVAGTHVPEEYVRDGQIILNVSPEALLSYDVSTEIFMFEVSFQGKATRLAIPAESIIQIFSKQGSEGMSMPDGLRTQRKIKSDRSQSNSSGALDQFRVLK